MKIFSLFAGAGLLAAPLAAQDPAITLKAARLLDGRGSVIQNPLVTIEGGRIVRIERARPGALVTYDLSGMTVMPGLIDAHAHIAWHFNAQGRLHSGNDGETPTQGMLAIAGNAHATLMAGFTTTQELGSPEDRDLRAAIAARGILGPRIVTSLDPISDARATPEQLRQLVRDRKAAGADLIKIFASRSIRDGGAQTLADSQLVALCDEAKVQELRTVVHAHSAESMRAVALAGCNQIEHGVFATAEVLRLLAERGTWYGPQCALVFRNYLDNRPKFEGIGNYNEAGFASMEKAIPLARAAVRLALATPGLKLVFGTDAVAGAHGRNAEDLVCRVQEGGQQPMDALISATSRNAEALGLGGEIGALAVGLQADIIGFDGDPSTDITVLRRPRFVMKGGRLVRYDGAVGGRP